MCTRFDSFRPRLWLCEQVDIPGRPAGIWGLGVAIAGKLTMKYLVSRSCGQNVRL